MIEAAVAAIPAIDLLAARPRCLARRQLAARRAGVFLQFVDGIQKWRIRSGDETGADAEAVYGCAQRHEFAQPVLVKIAARKDGRLAQARAVKDAAGAPRERREVAAVEPHALDRDALAPERRGERRNLAYRGFRVVGIDQEHGSFRKRPRKVRKRLRLVVVRLHEGMRHGAEHRYAEERVREHGGRAAVTGDIRGARGQQPGFRAVRPPQPEIHQQLARRRQHAARRLRRNHRLEMHQVDEPRLDQLRLRHGRHHAQYRLVGEKDGAFRHREHVAAEAQARQFAHELRRKERRALHPFEFLGTKAQAFQKIQRLLEPGCQQEVALRGKLADEKLEHCGLTHAPRKISVQHGELVEVGEQR